MFVVGEESRFEEARRERGGVAAPTLWEERNELVDSFFCKLGVDDLLSSLKEVELGVLRKPADCFETCGGEA